MKIYNLQKRVKVTMWIAEYHEIEANSMEEAVKNLNDNTFVYQEWLDDTILETKEFEITDENGNVLLETNN